MTLRIDDPDLLKRWAWCVEHAKRLGVDPAVFEARFSESDVADLCAPEHGKARVRACVATVVESIPMHARRGGDSAEEWPWR